MKNMMKIQDKRFQCLVAFLVLTLLFYVRLQYKVVSDEGTIRTVKKEQNLGNVSCKLPNGDMHVCWIGAHMLSKDGEFYQTIKRKASNDNVIILSSVDSAYVDMAINFYETSFKRFKISNFLFVCSDKHAVEMLAENGINCFLYPQDTINDKPTQYGYKEFFKKQRVKSKMVAAALMLGFTTVLSDPDIVFLQDPTPRFKIDADISCMVSVGREVNGGFYIAKPTSASIDLVLRVLQLVMTDIACDQVALTNVLHNMTASKAIRSKALLMHEFPVGLVYFEQANRTFLYDKPCLNGSCGVFAVHNNFMPSKIAKIYRFKENGMWSVDIDGYYSKPSRKYLQFSNPLDLGNKTNEKEKSALRAALTMAKLLNRTLILPSFHCCQGPMCILHCAFNHHFSVKMLENKFANQYREHVFLEHPLVPHSVKHSISKEIFIATSEMRNKIKTPKNVKVFNATDYKNGWVSAADVKNWFGKGELADFSVLQFHSLYINVKYDDKSWQQTLHNAIVAGHYVQ